MKNRANRAPEASVPKKYMIAGRRKILNIIDDLNLRSMIKLNLVELIYKIKCENLKFYCMKQFF